MTARGRRTERAGSDATMSLPGNGDRAERDRRTEEVGSGGAPQGLRVR